MGEYVDIHCAVTKAAAEYHATATAAAPTATTAALTTAATTAAGTADHEHRSHPTLRHVVFPPASADAVATERLPASAAAGSDAQHGRAAGPELPLTDADAATTAAAAAATAGCDQPEPLRSTATVWR